MGDIRMPIEDRLDVGCNGSLVEYECPYALPALAPVVSRRVGVVAAAAAAARPAGPECTMVCNRPISTSRSAS